MNHSTTQAKNGFEAANGLQAATTLLSATTVTGNEVCNMQNEKLGKIYDVMLDISAGKIRYAVLAAGGFMGMGDRLFAVPWKALKQDKDNRRFMLDVDVGCLKNAPGFDKDQWPNMADPSWNSAIESYYVS